MTTPFSSWAAKWLWTLRKHPGVWIIQGDEGWRVGRLYWHPKNNNDNQCGKGPRS